MESLGNLESFVRSADAGSFAAAARALGLSPAAVSKNVAKLEDSLGVLLFQRSTRQLKLTEVGERFLHEVAGGLETIEGAIAGLSVDDEPTGVLKASLPVGFGVEQLLPAVTGFAKRYPKVTLDVRFENRQVDLVSEGLDVAIGGAIELGAGVVARELSRIHVVALASPSFTGKVSSPEDLEAHPAVVMRSSRSGRVWPLTVKNAKGKSVDIELKPGLIVNDPEALCRCAAAGLGLTVAPLTSAARFLESGELVRLLPNWYTDIGAYYVYVASKRFLPAKTRAFIDFVVDYAKKERWSARFTTQAS